MVLAALSQDKVIFIFVLAAQMQGTGYGIVLGFGIFFSLFTSVIVGMDYRCASPPPPPPFILTILTHCAVPKMPAGDACNLPGECLCMYACDHMSFMKLACRIPALPILNCSIIFKPPLSSCKQGYRMQISQLIAPCHGITSVMLHPKG